MAPGSPPNGRRHRMHLPRPARSPAAVGLIPAAPRADR
jgi:hypothetical protein